MISRFPNEYLFPEFVRVHLPAPTDACFHLFFCSSRVTKLVEKAQKALADWFLTGDFEAYEHSLLILGGFAAREIDSSGCGRGEGVVAVALLYGYEEGGHQVLMVLVAHLRPRVSVKSMLLLEWRVPVFYYLRGCRG